MYYTPMLRERFYKRQWYVEECSESNSLHFVHKKMGLVFKTKEMCEDFIWKKIEKEGGIFLSEMPIVGRLKGTKVKRK